MSVQRKHKNKYSNKPGEGYETIIRKFYEDMATCTLVVYRLCNIVYVIDLATDLGHSLL